MEGSLMSKSLSPKNGNDQKIRKKGDGERKRELD